MPNQLQTTYHNALRRILVALRESAPCLVVLNKDLEVCIDQEDLKPAERQMHRKPCLEYAKPELPAGTKKVSLDMEEDILYFGRIVSYRMTKEDTCVCFGEKCHENHPIHTPENTLTSVWMNVSA